MKVTPTGAFRRDLKKLAKTDKADTIEALTLFASEHRAKGLNFEPVRSKSGYFTIRSNYSVRILLRKTGPDAFDAVAVGNHDFIYTSYFRK